MGTELEGELLASGRRHPCSADLGSDHAFFRGAVKGPVPYTRMTARAEGVRLILEFDGLRVELIAGAKAAQLAAKVREPPTRATKLGFKAGRKVNVVDVADRDLVSEMRHLGVKVREGVPKTDVDGLVVGATDAVSLARAVRLASKAGATWIVYPRGDPAIREADVIGAMREGGFKDVKVVRFSQTHTALRFVEARDLDE